MEDKYYLEQKRERCVEIIKEFAESLPLSKNVAQAVFTQLRQLGEGLKLLSPPKLDELYKNLLYMQAHFSPEQMRDLMERIKISQN